MSLQLISSDGQKFEIEVELARTSKLIANLLDDSSETEEIPVDQVSGKILQKVMDYLNHIKTTPATKIEKPLKGEFNECVSEWELSFIDLENEDLFDLMMAANFMEIKALLNLTCAKVASKIKGKNPDEAREAVGVVNDFPPEEYAKLYEENKWAWEN
jgi:S-phase kinase-associated protein 1